MRRAVIALVLVIAATAPAHADPADRAAYVQSLVRAVSDTPAAERSAIIEALQLGARTTCRATFGKPALRCLAELARTTCRNRGPACLPIADVAMTNLVAEDEWVDTASRVRIMSATDDYRAAMDRELLRRFAPLAAEMSLAPDFAAGDELGASIDRFCARYTARRRLAWQRCAAALVWYVGTTKGSRP